MSFRWVYSEPVDGGAVEQLEKALFETNGNGRDSKLSSTATHTIARLLTLRGISTFEQARHFFRPDLEE